MENLDLIPLDECCTRYNIETSFVISLQDHGLIHVTTFEEKDYLPLEELADLERMIRWHYELEINLEGIETIRYLLAEIRKLQKEVTQLKASVHTD